MKAAIGESVVAEPASTADILRSRPEESPAPAAPSASQPPSLYDLSAGLMGEASTISKELLQGRRGHAAELERLATDNAAKAKEEEAARKAARPVAPDLTPPPSTAARPFLSPPASVLGQVQTVMQGIGLLALGMAGAKGRGYAIAGTAALKGAAEGWAAGDAVRVERELEKWKTTHKQLMDQYQLERDAFNDLLTNQKMSMDQRFAEMRVRAEIMGMKDLAESTRLQDIDRTLGNLIALDQTKVRHEEAAVKLAAFLDAQQHRIFQEADALERRAIAQQHLGIAQERLQIAKELGGNVVKAQEAVIGLHQKIDNIALIRDALDIAENRGILQKGTTFLDKVQVALAMQSHPGDQELLKAVETINRLARPVLISAEMSLGMQGAQMRIKSMVEAEAGNPLGIPRGFWDMFLPKAEALHKERLKMYEDHLRSLNLLRAPAEPQILFKED